MKILVISDSHGSKDNVEILLNDTTYKHIFFLGDGLKDFNDIFDTRLIKVEGNCDMFSYEPLLTTINIENKKFMLCHGHQFKVKYSLYALCLKALEIKANVVCYGHTHEQRVDFENGIYLVNPGSLQNDRALEIEIKNDVITFTPFYVWERYDLKTGQRKTTT